MIGEGGTHVDAWVVALVGGSSGALVGSVARVLPGGYGCVGGVMTGKWLAVGVASNCSSPSGSDVDFLPG
jgi:hypothetical protein